MAANTQPIYSLTPKISGTEITTTNNTISDGTGSVGSSLAVVYSAGTNGSYVSVIRWSPVATAAGTNTTATVGRLFITSVTSGTTSPGTNIWLFAEYTLALQSADSSSAATYFIEIPVYKALPANWLIVASLHAVAANNTGWQVVAYGGDY
jgi:hypothetical protein